MDKLRRFQRLPWSDKALLLQAALRLAVVSLGVRVLHFSFWRRWLENHPTSPSAPASGTSPEHILWAVTVAGGYVPGANCLVRSLVGRSMLWRSGHSAELRLGVISGLQRPFQAHAWLEIGGRVVLGGTESASRYTALATEVAPSSPLAH